MASENILLLDALELAHAKIVELGGTPDWGRVMYMRHVDRIVSAVK